MSDLVQFAMGASDAIFAELLLINELFRSRQFKWDFALFGKRQTSGFSSTTFLLDIIRKISLLNLCSASTGVFTLK